VIGMSGNTGRRLSDLEHLRQSIADILRTPIGSRVMRREYGSRLFQLVDRPVDKVGLVEVYAATAEALGRWEPRLRLTRVQAERVYPGGVELTLEGVYQPDGRQVKLEGIQA
jgi:hypothetical protein